MDLQIANQMFIVCGATSGFGLGITRALCQEHANVIGIARGAEALFKLENEYHDQFQGISGDLQDEQTLDKIYELLGGKIINGVLINSGGPPAKAARDATLQEWDKAYKLLFRWKVELIRKLLPVFQQQKYGRILFIESQSVKQPINHLVLSTAMRSAVVGYAKTLSQEVAGEGITVNVLAPGSHNTPAIDRIIRHKSRQMGITFEEAKSEMNSSIPVGRMGEADELACLALFMLSTRSAYITGQTISHDGGTIKGLFG